MAFIDDVKARLRISGTNFDTEITQLIASAKHDLLTAGVSASAIEETDPKIREAISLYIKSRFGLENPDSEKYWKSYESEKAELLVSPDYTGF